MYPCSEKETIEKMEEDELRKREDVINFYKSEIGFEVFEAILLKDYHRTLLPLVYLEHIRKEMALQELEL